MRAALALLLAGCGMSLASPTSPFVQPATQSTPDTPVTFRLEIQPSVLHRAKEAVVVLYVPPFERPLTLVQSELFFPAKCKDDLCSWYPVWLPEARMWSRVVVTVIDRRGRTIATQELHWICRRKVYTFHPVAP